MTYELPTTVEQATGQHVLPPMHHNIIISLCQILSKARRCKEATTPFCLVLHVPVRRTVLVPFCNTPAALEYRAALPPAASLG
jgi:hypothetical protein